MSTETIIKVGGIKRGTKELSIKKKGPPISIIHKETIGGEDWIEGAGAGIGRLGIEGHTP